MTKVRSRAARSGNRRCDPVCPNPLLGIRATDWPQIDFSTISKRFRYPDFDTLKSSGRDFRWYVTWVWWFKVLYHSTDAIQLSHDVATTIQRCHHLNRDQCAVQVHACLTIQLAGKTMCKVEWNHYVYNASAAL